MYDYPAVRRATDRWWAGLSERFRRAGMRNIPDRLSRPGEGATFWLAPDLLFSQSCGFPLVSRMAGRVTLLGTPCYDMDGCEGIDYRSLLIVRASSAATGVRDLRGLKCAINKADSWSGHHVLRLIAAPLIDHGRPAFQVVRSGSHAGSIDAVRSGSADFACVDCVSFGLLARYCPHLVAGLRILDRTPALPGLPLIAGAAACEDDIRRMRQGLRAAFGDPVLAGVREELGLKDFQPTAIVEYERLSAALAQLEFEGIPQFL